MPGDGRKREVLHKESLGRNPKQGLSRWAFVKQSQFLLGGMNVNHYIRGGYVNIKGGRAAKTKANQSQFGLALHFVLVVAEGSVQEMSYDDDQDQQDHEDHGGVRAVGCHLVV